MASIFDESYLPKAEEILEKGKELSPKRQELYYELGWIKLLQEKTQEAIDVFKQAVDLDKKIALSHWYLGLILLVDNNYKEGLKEIEKSRDLGQSWGGDTNTILFIAQAYAELSNYKEAVSLCDFVLKKQPENIEAMTRKTIYFAKDSQKREALKLLEEISKINKVLAEELKRTIETELKKTIETIE